MKLDVRPVWPTGAAQTSVEGVPVMNLDSQNGQVQLASAYGPATMPTGIALAPTPIETFPDEADIPGGTWKDPLRNARNRLGAVINRIGLDSDQFTVLSNDCWGQALYAGYNLPCQTPFAGSGMYSDCFLRFLGDVEGYLKSPLNFVTQTRYLALQRIRNQRRAWPIAVLGDDVEVHFMHYQSEYASRRAWDAGLDHLHLDRLAVKFTADKDGATEAQVKQFAALPFERKLLLSKRSRPDTACAVHTPEFVINGAVMFRRSLKHFDCTHWLNTGEIVTDTPRVWVNKILYARGA